FTMGLPQIETCCFVLDLKTGNIVMGSINALLSFVMFIIMVVVACTLEPFKELAADEKDFDAEAAFTGLYAMSIILCLMFLAKFFFDVFFVYGVLTERAGIIRGYFIMWVVFFLLSMFTFFLNAPHFSAGHICMEVFYIGEYLV
ncbi:jg16557, partial [Pararge aegeria aegeria]